MTFKFLEVLQLFVKVLSHTWGLWSFQGHLFQAAQQRGRGGGGGGPFGEGLGASWNDPPRICWIKSLHLDIIVSLLWRELLLPEWDQISGPKMATCQELATSHGNIGYSDKAICLRLVHINYYLSFSAALKKPKNLSENQHQIKVVVLFSNYLLAVCELISSY